MCNFKLDTEKMVLTGFTTNLHMIESLEKAIGGELSGECPISFLQLSPKTIWLICEETYAGLAKTSEIDTSWPGAEALLREMVLI